MMADILGIPVSLGSCEETGALGGAMAAAIGIGLYGDEGQAVASIVAAGRGCSPTRNAVRCTIAALPCGRA